MRASQDRAIIFPHDKVHFTLDDSDFFVRYEVAQSS
jgi:hypothetical protein